MTRGIIAAPFVFRDNGNSMSIDRVISEEELRYYALYWEKVVIPDSNLVTMKLPDQEVLLETGVIFRPLVEAKGHFNFAQIAAYVRQSQAQIAKDLIQGEPHTDWALHQIGANFSLPAEFGIPARTVRVELQKALPMPDGRTPMVDILEFKERRRDELEQLHQHLDEAYIEVLRSPDPGLQTRAALGQLNKSIAALGRVAGERWKISKKVDLSVELNLDGSKLLTGAAAAAAFEFYTQSGISIPIGAIAGGLISLLKVSAKKSMTFEPAKQNLKLSYLLHAQSSNILSPPK